MSEKVKVIFDQSALDIALQTTGSISNIVLFAEKNNISITDELKANQELTIPKTADIRGTIFKYYKQNKVLPATGFTKHKHLLEKQEGISVWIINQDFIVQ